MESTDRSVKTRVFISQPMNGKTYSEIKNERKKAIEAVRKGYPDEEIKIIDNLFDEDYEIVNPMWYLGNSNARGCRIEFICAFEYGIKFMTVM